MIGDVANKLAGAEFDSANGTTGGAVTVPTGWILSSWWMLAATGTASTMTMDPAYGPNGPLNEQTAFTLPANGGSYGETFTGEIVAGTILTFGNTAAYRCTFAKPRS